MSPRSPIRVLHLINGLGTGGAERSLAQMLPYLAERGVASTVVCIYRREEGVQDEVIAHGRDVRFLPEGIWLRRAAALRQIISSTRPHLIHTTLFESDLLGRIASVGTGIPVVTSLVNVSYDPVRMGDPNVRAYKLRALQVIDALTGRVRNRGWHAISQSVADSNVHHLKIPPEKITVIPRARPTHGADPETTAEVRTRIRRQLEIPPDAEIILAVGRQEYQKAQSDLVKAFSRFADRFPSAWLLIAGREGNATSQLRSAIEDAESPGRILLLGHRSDVPELLQASDVFAFPSLYEGLGGSLLEAMSVGSAIVASDILAIREVAGDAIWYAAPGDIESLTQRLETLVANPAMREQLGCSALRRFNTWPSLDEVSDAMAAWFHAAAGGEPIQKDGSG